MAAVSVAPHDLLALMVSSSRTFRQFHLLIYSRIKSTPSHIAVLRDTDIICSVGDALRSQWFLFSLAYSIYEFGFWFGFFPVTIPKFISQIGSARSGSHVCVWASEWQASRWIEMWLRLWIFVSVCQYFCQNHQILTIRGTQNLITKCVLKAELHCSEINFEDFLPLDRLPPDT